MAEFVPLLYIGIMNLLKKSMLFYQGIFMSLIIVFNTGYKKTLGYLPQFFGIYENISGSEFLKYMAAIKGIDRRALGKACPYSI